MTDFDEMLRKEYKKQVGAPKNKKEVEELKAQLAGK